MNIFEYFLLFLLYFIVGYLIYQNIKLRRLIKRQELLGKKALDEAGQALTGTLKVAFDNIKRLMQKTDKISSTLKDHTEKIHSIMIVNKRKHEILQSIEKNSETIKNKDSKEN
jgi:hypothetical protein